MSVITFEGIVEDGQIRLSPAVRLPDNTKVFVVVPEMQVEPAAHILSPRLVHKEQAPDFRMTIFEETSDADI
jgi:hypothetical protein